MRGRVVTADMKIDKVLAVYKTSPMVLVVESEEGKLFELSLTELKGAGHSSSDDAWKRIEVIWDQKGPRSDSGMAVA
jgi:hypothetical protein